MDRSAPPASPAPGAGTRAAATTSHPPGAEPDAAAAPVRVPPVVHAVLFASFCVLFGVAWDISWHETIGRDAFFSPPHMAIYVGGLVAGLGSGLLVLWLSFGWDPLGLGRRAAGGETAALPAVTFWRYFRGPLGAWVCIWGALAMMTSAPFDDWWHNAYGLDVEIISPPHVVLALGIGAINLGALVMVLPWMNRAREEGRTGAARRMGWLHAVAAGLLFLMVATFTTEYHFRIWMHASRFWTATALAFPWVLLAAARSSTLRWPATATVAVYTVFRLVAVWTFPLFEGEPRLGPVLQPVEVFVPPDFPLLLLVPAVAIDLVMRRWGRPAGEEGSASAVEPRTGGAARPAGSGQWRDWGVAVVTGVLFLGLLLAVQWPFAEFLMSEGARNWIFGTEHVPYFVPDRSALVENRFIQPHEAAVRWRNIGLAFLWSVGSARVGLWLGSWMRRVRR